MPKFSIIIPARNEEELLPACLEAVRRSAERLKCEQGWQSEVIVVLNRCTDRTREIAENFGALTASDDSKNLSCIRNSGAKAASGDYLVTIDADSRMSENMLPEIARALSRDDVVGGGVLTLPERWSAGIIVTAICLLPIVLRHQISAGLFFCRRADFEALGGFNTELSTAEDIDFAKRLKAHGKRSGRRFITIYRASIVTSCRKLDRLGDWYFVLRPWLFVQLLRGRNQAEADRIWYDFPR